MQDPVIFREYDIRGIYNKQFDDAFATSLGQGFVQFLKDKYHVQSPTISIGYDARLSSPQLADHLAKGLSQSGARVIRLGLITTPISYFSNFSLKTDGSIMITGSHNPPDYNGFKICANKNSVFGEEIQELKSIIEANKFIQEKGSIESHDIFPAYLEKHTKEFNFTKDKINVVLDCGNGAAGCIARKLYESVGVSPKILFEKPDGNFPNHHPDPTVEENLKDLKDEVQKRGADIGIGFDGDADRIGIVDNQGNAILGDEMMIIIARDLLSKTPGEKIIGDVKCSDRLFEDIQKRGGSPIMWKTGHSLIKEKIKNEKSPFGGELSGHIFFADRNFGYDDALYAGLRLIEILETTGKSIPELLEGLPKAYNTPEIRIDTTEEKKKSVVEKIKKIYSEDSDRYKVNLIDGVRISFSDGWALVRSSNTQPVIVLRFESHTQEGLSRIQTEIESKIQEIIE